MNILQINEINTITRTLYTCVLNVAFEYKLSVVLCNTAIYIYNQYDFKNLPILSIIKIIYCLTVPFSHID